MNVVFIEDERAYKRFAKKYSSNNIYYTWNYNFYEKFHSCINVKCLGNTDSIYFDDVKYIIDRYNELICKLNLCRANCFELNVSLEDSIFNRIVIMMQVFRELETELKQVDNIEKIYMYGSITYPTIYFEIVNLFAKKRQIPVEVLPIAFRPLFYLKMKTAVYFNEIKNIIVTIGSDMRIVLNSLRYKKMELQPKKYDLCLPYELDYERHINSTIHKLERKYWGAKTNIEIVCFGGKGEKAAKDDNIDYINIKNIFSINALVLIISFWRDYYRIKDNIYNTAFLIIDDNNISNLFYKNAIVASIFAIWKTYVVDAQIQSLLKYREYKAIICSYYSAYSKSLWIHNKKKDTKFIKLSEKHDAAFVYKQKEKRAYVNNSRYMFIDIWILREFFPSDVMRGMRDDGSLVVKISSGLIQENLRKKKDGLKKKDKKNILIATGGTYEGPIAYSKYLSNTVELIELISSLDNVNIFVKHHICEYETELVKKTTDMNAKGKIRLIDPEIIFEDIIDDMDILVAHPVSTTIIDAIKRDIVAVLLNESHIFGISDYLIDVVPNSDTPEKLFEYISRLIKDEVFFEKIRNLQNNKIKVLCLRSTEQIAKEEADAVLEFCGTYTN